MNINYNELASLYKPTKISTLLIGEAPPPSGKKYFYLIPDKYNPRNPIEQDQSLPATVFNHYFGRRPNSPEEYRKFLICLKEHGIFLIDLINLPLRIRNNKEHGGINIESIEQVFSDANLAVLNNRIEEIADANTEIIFLIARNYKKVYKSKLSITTGIPFTKKNYIRWKDFRLTTAYVLCFV
jgi:hypothetical protein